MSETPTISPMNYLKIFFRRKEMLIIPAILGLVVGICTSMVLPKKYVSSTVLLVEDGKTDNPLFAQIAVSTTIQQRLATIRESMLGWNSVVKLVKRLGMDKEIKTQKEFESLISKIRRNIIIKLKSNNIINLSYVGDEPKQTQLVVKNITDIFIERNVDIQNEDTTDAVVFIEEQLKVYRSKIKSSEIAKLKESLNTLLVDSTEAHPRVKQLRELIKAKQNELKKENLEYIETTPTDFDKDNPIISEIKKTLDTMEQKTESNVKKEGIDEQNLYKVMLIDKLDNAMARDENVNNKIYNMLLERLETAKITQRLQSSKEGTRYTVLDPPRVPLTHSKPNKKVVAAAGLAIGLGIGIGLIFISEFLDKSFLDVEEANHFFGQPLLGAISKITTEDNIKKEREKAICLYTITLIVGIAAVMITKAVVNFQG